MASCSDDASSEFRIVQPKSMGPMNRLFGSVGVDGDGTPFELEHVDPFILGDFVSLPINLNEPPMRPPFCAHPHCGNAVASVLIEGEQMSMWDNIQGFENDKLHAGGVYVVCTGTGCVHDEFTDAVVTERVIRRAPFGFPTDAEPGRNFRFFQLWFDPGHVHAEGGPPPVKTAVMQPEAVPVASSGAMKIRVLVGEYAGLQGVPMPVSILHCGVLPFTGSGTVTIPAGTSGFLCAISRPAMVKIGAAEEGLVVPAAQELLLPAKSESYDLNIDVALDDVISPEDAKADEALQVLVCFGPPTGKPFYKLLGYGGGLVASSEEKVRERMLEYERDPKNFGIPSGGEPADTARYGLQVGYKNPFDDRGECQRNDPAAAAPEARWHRAEDGPYQPKGKGKGK